MRAGVLPFFTVVVAAGCGGGGSPAVVTEHTTETETIYALALPEGDALITNAYLIESDAGRVLVDTGTQQATDELDVALTDLGLARSDIDLAVVTHGHPDHAGGAAFLQETWRAPIFIGHADRGIVDEGTWPALTVQSPEGWLVLHLIDHDPIPVVDLAVSVDRETDLAPYGVAGRIIPTPGHTPGSVSVLLDSGAVFVGDMARSESGADDNAMRTHVFGVDLESDQANMQMLLNRGGTRFFPGHGGPVSADNVRAWLGS